MRGFGGGDIMPAPGGACREEGSGASFAACAIALRRLSARWYHQAPNQMTGQNDNVLAAMLTSFGERLPFGVGMLKKNDSL